MKTLKIAGKLSYQWEKIVYFVNNNKKQKKKRKKTFHILKEQSINSLVIQTLNKTL